MSFGEKTCVYFELEAMLISLFLVSFNTKPFRNGATDKGVKKFASGK